MRWLPSLLHRKTPPAAPLPRPEAPVCVIGDLHGRLDLLEAMLARIAAQPNAAQARILLVGDLVDRGPDSAAVLTRVMALHKADPARVICLMGNHERMLLDFLQDAPRHGPRWIANGGSDTLISFGLSPFARRQNEDALHALAQDLRAKMGAGMVAWLEALPLCWQEGQLAVTHAGADPQQPMETQSPRRMIWGPRKREAAVRCDDVWVAQGHVIVTAAHAKDQRIWVDTGAWRSGQLCAAWIDANGLSFINIFSEK